MKIVSCFFIVVLLALSTCCNIHATNPTQEKIDEIGIKLLRAVRARVDLNELKAIVSDDQKLIRLPESPRYDGNEDGVDLQFCKNGQDDSEELAKKKTGSDPRKAAAATASSTYYKRSALHPLCGRYVIDNFLDDEEIDYLRDFAQFGMNMGGGGEGGVTLVDFVGAIVSHGTRFANLTIIANRHQARVAKERASGLDLTTDLADVIPSNGMLIWLRTIHKIHRLVEIIYDTKSVCPSASGLRYALPAFFSRIDAAPPKTANDEYWHTHVDTEQYGSFDITTLLYISSESETMSPTEFGDFIAGSAASKLARNHPHETKEEKKRRILDDTEGNRDYFRQSGFPTPDEMEEMRARSDRHFQGGAFEFLSSRKDPTNLGPSFDGIPSTAADDENDPEICHISENAAESMKKIKEQGKTCAKKLVIHPKKGRLTLFSSGHEHPHRIDRVRDGVRWTATNAFTCDAHGKSVDMMKETNHGEFPHKWLLDLAAQAVLASP